MSPSPRAPRARRLLAVALALVTALPPAASRAAPAPPASVASGRLVVVAFGARGAPLEGVALLVTSEAPAATAISAVTDRRGVARVALPPGPASVRLQSPLAGNHEEMFPVVITKGFVTELIATIFDDGRPMRTHLEAVSLVDAPDAGAAGDAGPEAPPGELVGRVEDAEKGRPIRGVRVYVRGQSVEGETDAAGRFALTLPSGLHDLTLVHAQYAALTVRAVEVRPAPEAAPARTFALEPASIELAELVVSAPRIVGSALEALEERREATAVGEVIGAQQMSRSGDTNAASALRRATGVTVVGGRFVYVRGLGERYSSTLLDGAQLPSPEPERRVVPLDMFPAAMLEGIAIQKGYTPDMPGEFGGGVVRIRTRGFPGALEGRASVGTSARLGTTFQDHLFAASGPTDFLGVDGGFRALPPEVRGASDAAPLLERDMFSERGYTAAELERFGELMLTDWTPRRDIVPPGASLQGNVGDSVETPFGRAGWLAAAGYSSDWDGGPRDVRIYTVGSGGRMEPAHQYRFDDLEMRVTLSGIASGGLDFGDDHKLRLTSLLNRVTTDEARLYEGYNRDVTTDIRVSRLQWVEQMLSTNQLRGDHRLAPDLELGWRYTLSAATRLEPDRRQARYDREPGTDLWRLSDRPEGNRRVFSGLVDVAHDVGLDLTWHLVGAPAVTAPDAPPPPPADTRVALKTGFALVTKEREVDTRRFKYDQQGPRAADEDLLLLTPEQIFTPDNIGPDGFVLTETTLETDNYTAGQTILGGYLMADATLARDLTLVGGVRLESSTQRVGTFVPFSPDAATVEARLGTLDLLPSLAASWALREDMFLRFGASQTVSRPDFRELSPATFNDVTGGRQFFGNPDLRRALLRHVDLRWEWFPTAGELVSVGVFYKHFKDPIEMVLVPSAQLSVTYANAAAAQNLGLELEFRKNLAFLAPALRDLYVASNVALIASSVDIGDAETIQTNKRRPLQGQAPYVVNLQLGYEDADSGTNAALLYNVSGRRIDEVGALGAPDTYIEAFHQLDLVLGLRLPHRFELNARAQNLLDMPQDTRQGTALVERDLRGRVFSLALARGF